MIEVEAKAAIARVEPIRRIAATLGSYIGKEHKVDDYYALFSNGYPHKSIRIRKHDAFYEVNFKHSISYLKGVHAKQETEFKVSNVKDYLALLKDIGYRIWLRKAKNSYVYEIHKHFHIEINHVRGLGWFAEVEYLVHKKSEIRKARKEVLRILNQLGFNENDLIKAGYTKLLWKKKHKK